MPKFNIGCDKLQNHLDTVVGPTWNFAGRLDRQQDHVMNAVVGLAAEAGEVLDEHKKLYYHTAKNRRDDIVREIGDVLYYLPKLMALHNITLDEALAANRAKLEARHEDKFTKVG